MPAPDWTSDDNYAWTEVLSRREWAWEFLRRNEEFRKAWKNARCEYGIAGYDAQTTIIAAQHQVSSLAQWGCLYCNSPDEDARSAAVFWLPEWCPSVLRLRGFALSENVEATPFLLREIATPSTLLELPHGPQHLLFTGNGRTLQLVIAGADVMRPIRLMADGAPDRAMAGHQLRSLQCFLDLRLSGRLYPSHIQREPLSLYRRLVLRALDGEIAGASQQEIARHVISGYSDEKWYSPDRPLRERVRRALRRGRALMKRGYRDLLS